MTKEEVSAIVRKKFETLRGVQSELDSLIKEIAAISPKKANKFEKAVLDLLNSGKYKAANGVNVREVATDLLGEINKDPNPVAAYDKHRENLVALLTQVEAFVGEMKKMAEAAIQKAKDEIIEANRKRLADEAATATRLAAEAEAQRIATEARLATERAETARQALEAAALAAARAVVSDAINPPVRREAPSPTGAPASRDDGEVTQADAGIKLPGTSGQRPDGQGLEENDIRKAAEIAAAAEKAREKEQEKERVLAWVVDQMQVLVDGRRVLGLLGSQVGELSVQVKNDFLDAVSKLCKERGYSYTSPNDPQNITVDDRLKQISEAQDPVAEWTQLNGLIDADMVKAKKLFVDVQALAATYLKRAQEVNIAERIKKRAASEEETKRKVAAAAELTRKNAEVDGWLNSIDESIKTYLREYTAIDDDMKANFPSIYDGFKDGVNHINQSPIYHSGQDYTLGVLERAMQYVPKAPDRFEEYSVRKDSVADCLEKDTKRLAAIKELAERMKRAEIARREAKAIQDTVAAANRVAREAVEAQIITDAKVEAQAIKETSEKAIKLGLEDAQRQKAAELARATEQREEKMPQYGFAEMDEMAKKIVLPVPPTGEPPRPKERGDNSTPLQLAAPKDKEQIDKEQKGKGKPPDVTADAKKDVGNAAPEPEIDPAKAARIKQLEAKIALEKSIINSPTSSEDRRKYAQRDLDPLEREYRILTHTASHEEWVAEVARLKARIDKLLSTKEEISDKLRRGGLNRFQRDYQDGRRRDNSEELTSLDQDLTEAEKQEKLTATAENRLATSTPLPDAKVEGAARVVTNETLAQTREERWKKAIPSGSYTLESVPDSLHTLTVAGAQYEVFAVLCDDIKLPDGLKDPAAKKKEFMRQLNAASESTVIFFCKNKTTNEPQIVLYQHQRAGSIKALRQLTTLQQSEGSRLALEENGINAITWADFALSPATYTFVLEQLKRNNLAIGPDIKGAYRADIVYDAGGPQLSFGQPLAAAGESPSHASLLEEDKKDASLGTAMVIEWVGAEQNISGIPKSMNTDEAYVESIKKLNNLGIVDAKAHPYGVVEGVGKLIDFVGSIPVTEEALVAYMDYVGSYYGIPQNIIEASKRNRAEVLKTFIAKAESFKDDERGQYDRSRSECIDQVVAQARVSLPAVEAQCAQEKSAHTAHVEAQAKLAREQKLCARFVDDWKQYVDEQISALEALIPQAKDTMSEENLNKFRKIVREYNTALQIINEKRDEKKAVPGWEGLAATFPSDGASPAAARFAELKTQFEQLHLQESLDYTYAITEFKEKYIDGVASYLFELRQFSVALGKISLEGVASRQALEQSRDQAVTEKLKKAIEMSGYGTETVGKLATYATLYKSLSAPNSGVSPALVELQLPVITDALGKTYQTLIAETTEHAIAQTRCQTISEAIDKLRGLKESVASNRFYVLRNIDDFRRIPGALTTIAKAVSPITDPALREVITKGNKTSDYESLTQAEALYRDIRSALDKGPNTDRLAANAAEARGAEARVDTRLPESAPQAAQVEGFVPYQGSTRTLAEAVRAKREIDRSPRVAYLEYYQKHPEKIVSFEGTVYLLGRTFDAGANGRVFEAFVATEEQQQALHIQMGERYNPTTIDKVWIQKNTPQVVSGADGVQRIAGQEIVDDLTTPEFGTLQPTHLALKFKRDTMMVIQGGIGTGEAVSFQRELDVYRRFSTNEELKAHSPQLHGNFHTSFPEGALAMTWVDGELSMSGPVSDDEILRVADELLALIDASEQVRCPLGHDNVKSGSVMMCPDGQVRLIDLDNDGIEGRNKNLAQTLQLLALQSLASKGNISYGMSELLSRISGLEDLRSADARRAQIVELTKAIAEYRALRSQDVPTLTAQMNDATVPASRRLAAFDVLSEKMKGKVSPELATAASQLYFDQSVNTALSWTERELSRSLGSTRFPADMRYLILPLIPLKDTQAVQNTKDRNLDKLAEQFPANHELQAMTAALRLLSKAITHTDYRERERERKRDAYWLANICQDIPGISLDGADKWLIKLIPYSMAKGRNYEVYTARDIIGAYKRDPVYRYGLADLTGHMLPAKRIEIIQEQDVNTTHIDLKDIKDGGSIVDVITYPGYSPDRPELTISNGWVSTRSVDANMTLEPTAPWSSIDKLYGKDSRITLKGGQGRHVDSWIDGAIRIVAPPEQAVSPTQLFVRSVKIHEQFVDKGAKFAPVRLDIEDAAAKVLVGVGSEDIACDHKDQLYILDKSAFGEQYKINIPADYKGESITFAAQSAEGNKNAHVVFVRRKIGTREEWLFSHFVDDDSKSDGNGDVNREKKTEQFGQKTIDEANGLLESWTNFTQSQKTENPTLSYESDSRLLRSAISNLLNARARGQDLVKLSGLLETLKAQIPISQRNLEAAMANPVAYANAKLQALALPEGISEVPESMSGVSKEVEVPEMTDELRALIPKMYLDSFARAYKKSIIGGGFMDTTGRPFDCTYDGGTGILELRRKGGDTIRVRYTS